MPFSEIAKPSLKFYLSAKEPKREKREPQNVVINQFRLNINLLIKFPQKLLMISLSYEQAAAAEKRSFKSASMPMNKHDYK
jgi:hypothetical protein